MTGPHANTTKSGKTNAMMDVSTIPNILGFPDLILTHGKIVTADPAFSIAEALAVRDGRFLAVGDTASLSRLAGPDTKVVDLEGATVLPGLIDTHAHVEAAGLLALTVSFDGAQTADEAIRRVAMRAREVRAGEWIVGGSWHPVSQLAEKRYLTRQELDYAALEHPVCLPIGHFTMVNSLALERAGISSATPDPYGGTIHRDPSTGEPTGLLEESACSLVEDLLPALSEEQRLTQVTTAMRYFNEHGITSAISAAVSPELLRAHQRVCLRGAATLRISAMYAPTTPAGSLNPLVSLEEWERLFSYLGTVSDFGNEWLSYSGIKLQIDGGMTLRTAAMRDGYPDDPDYHGTIVMEPERFNALVAVANRHGWRVGVHAVGDMAIDRVLDAYELADRERSIRGRRFIVIHGSLITQDQMDRAKALDVRVDAQSSFLWDKASLVARYLGKGAADRAFPMRSMIDRMGLDLLGQGTDFPFNPLNPFINMSVMVTRRDRSGAEFGAAEAISRVEAIRLYTSAAARYAFAEERVGSIEKGKLADLVVLSDDILTIPERQLSSITIKQTIIGGKVVYDAAQQRRAKSGSF